MREMRAMRESAHSAIDTYSDFGLSKLFQLAHSTARRENDLPFASLSAIIPMATATFRTNLVNRV